MSSSPAKKPAPPVPKRVGRKPPVPPRRGKKKKKIRRSQDHAPTPPAVAGSLARAEQELRRLHAEDEAAPWRLERLLGATRVERGERDGERMVLCSGVFRCAAADVARVLREPQLYPRFWPGCLKAASVASYAEDARVLVADHAAPLWWSGGRRSVRAERLVEAPELRATLVVWGEVEPRVAAKMRLPPVRGGPCASVSTAVVSGQCGGGFLLSPLGRGRCLVRFLCTARSLVGGWAGWLSEDVRVLDFVAGVGALAEERAQGLEELPFAPAVQGQVEEQGEQGEVVEDEEEEDDDEEDERLFPWLKENRFSESVEEVMEEVWDAVEGKGWQGQDTREGVKLSTKDDPAGHWSVWVKGSKLVDVPAATLVDYLVQQERKGEIDDMFAKGTLLETVDASASVWHLEFKPKFPASARDSCQYQVVLPWVERGAGRPSKGQPMGFMIISRSTRHDAAPETNKFVRVEVGYSAMVMIPRGGNSTELHFVAKTYLGGNIPGFVLKFVTTTQPLVVNKIQEVCRKLQDHDEKREKWRKVFEETLVDESFGEQAGKQQQQQQDEEQGEEEEEEEEHDDEGQAEESSKRKSSKASGRKRPKSVPIKVQEGPLVALRWPEVVDDGTLELPMRYATKIQAMLDDLEHLAAAKWVRTNAPILGLTMYAHADMVVGVANLPYEPTLVADFLMDAGNWPSIDPSCQNISLLELIDPNTHIRSATFDKQRCFVDESVTIAHLTHRRDLADGSSVLLATETEERPPISLVLGAWIVMPHEEAHSYVAYVNHIESGVVQEEVMSVVREKQAMCINKLRTALENASAPGVRLRRSSTGSVPLDLMSSLMEEQKAAEEKPEGARFSAGDRVLAQEEEGSPWTYATVKKRTETGYELEFNGRDRLKAVVDEMRVAPAPVIVATNTPPNTPPADLPAVMGQLAGATPTKKKKKKKAGGRKESVVEAQPDYFLMK